MLILKEATVNDFDFYYNLKCEETSVYWSGFSQAPNRITLRDYWQNLTDGKIIDRQIFILFDDLAPVGYVQAVNSDTETGLSMGIIDKARGRGYGNEIIREIIDMQGSNRQYYCYVREDNLPSEKSFIRNGFVKTGESYDHFFDLDQKYYKMNKYIRKKERLLAIIPARSGSKGLTDKNIMNLDGKPLLAYSVEAALQSGLFDIVHVSTDSQEYSEIAKTYGADEPFLRDKQNAEDNSSSWDAVREALRKYQATGKTFDICVLLQPTSPMRSAGDIRDAYRFFVDNKAKSLTSVTEVDHPVQWCFQLDDTCSMKAFASSPYKNCRRQELEKYYHENGAIYIARVKDICDPLFDFYSEKCIAYVMDSDRSIDIDTEKDFIIAEAMMQRRTGARG